MRRVSGMQHKVDQPGDRPGLQRQGLQVLVGVVGLIGFDIQRRRFNALDVCQHCCRVGIRQERQGFLLALLPQDAEVKRLRKCGP